MSYPCKNISPVLTGHKECDCCGACLVPEKYTNCAECGNTIYVGDGYFDLEGDNYCVNCTEKRRKTA